MSTPRVLLLAFGDGSANTDQILSMVIERIGKHPVADSWWLTLVEDTELRIEHALQLRGSDLAVFVDMGPIGNGSFTFSAMASSESYRILPMEQTLEPSDILHTVATLNRRGELPSSFRLTLPAGRNPEDSAVGSESSQRGIDAAVDFLGDLLNNPDAEAWRARSTAVI